MSNQPKSRSVIGWGLAAVVLLVALVLAVGVPGLSNAPESAEAPSAAASQAAASSGEDLQSSPSTQGGSQQSQEPSEPQEAPPMPPCWAEMARIDRELSFENFRSVLAAAAERQDQYLLTYLQERLIRLVGNDPRRALEVLSWAEQAGEGMELVVYMEALKKAPAVHNSKVSDRLLDMAENPKGSLALRAASVIGLETQKRFEPPALERMKALALDGTVDQVAWNATRTIGRVMEQDFKSGGSYKPYWDQLLDISQKSEDRAVRGLALEMPTYPELIMDDGSVGKLGDIMRTDRDHEIRELAAMRLSVTESPEKALEAYRAAFATETEYCARWAFFRYAVRAAGPASLPVLQQLAQQDPRFQQDYLDFKGLYEQGIQDWQRIWLNKKLYPEHIACMDKHEAVQ